MRVDSATTRTATGTATAEPDPTSAAVLGKEFLQLLITQLQNQDPLEPLDNTELVSQLAQLSSLDSLQSIEQSLQTGQGLNQLAQAAALIGSTVRASAEGGEVSGKVSAAQITATGQVQLVIEGQAVPLSAVVEVRAG